MNTRGLIIFFGIPVFIVTILLFINNLAFLGADNISKNSQATQSSESTGSEATVPTDLDSINIFFQAIDQKDSALILGVIDPSILKTQQEADEWSKQFSAFEKVTVKDIQPSNQTQWKDDNRIYKVTVNAKMNPESAKAPIPYYGWGDGDIIKWITLRKGADELWRVAGFASGM